MSVCCPGDVPSGDTSFLLLMLPLLEKGHSLGRLAMGHLLTPAKPCQDPDLLAHLRLGYRGLSQGVIHPPTSLSVLALDRPFSIEAEVYINSHHLRAEPEVITTCSPWVAPKSKTCYFPHLWIVKRPMRQDLPYFNVRRKKLPRCSSENSLH